MEEVCIIGGGLSGILSAKLSLSYNLQPFVLEKSSSFGGLWRGFPSEVGVWDSLHVNLSKYAMSISDHLWPEEIQEFPSCKEYLSYLSSFVESHNLLQYFHFNSEVISVSKEGSNYRVTYKNDIGLIDKIFKYVLIGIGNYSRPREMIKNKEIFSGETLHAGYYRDPSIFKDKNVVVVGKSYSAGDIAFDALKTAKTVTQVYREKSACGKRYLQGFPYDFLFFNFVQQPDGLPLEYTLSRNAEMVKGLIQATENPGEIDPNWVLTEEEIQSKFITFPVSCDEYYDAVKNGKIICIQGKAEKFTEKGILLDSGQEIEADFVVSATGYCSNYDFLSEEIKNIVKYEPEDQKLPVSLYRGCFHPELPGLAFVGKVFAVLIAQAELSVEVGLRWITGMIQKTQEEIWEGVRLEERLRNDIKSSMWVYDFYVLQREMMELSGNQVDYQWLEEIQYTKRPLSAVVMFRNREGQEERIREFVRQVKSKYPEFPFN